MSHKPLPWVKGKEGELWTLCFHVPGNDMEPVAFGYFDSEEDVDLILKAMNK